MEQLSIVHHFQPSICWYYTYLYLSQGCLLINASFSSHAKENDFSRKSIRLVSQIHRTRRELRKQTNALILQLKILRLWREKKWHCLWSHRIKIPFLCSLKYIISKIVYLKQPSHKSQFSNVREVICLSYTQYSQELFYRKCNL